MFEQLSLYVPGTASVTPMENAGIEVDRDRSGVPTKTLRPYQVRISTQAKELLQVHASCLVPMATGTGKTVTAYDVIRWAVHEQGRRVLWNVHREELVDQAYATFQDIANTQREIGDWRADAAAQIVIASKDSLRFRLKRYPKDHFGLIVTDEVHHGIASTYRKIYEHFSAGTVQCWHLGLTATPDRTDRLALGSDLGGILSSHTDPYLYDTALEDGYLVPFLPKRIKLKEVDLSNVRTLAGDLNQGQLAAIMESEKPLHGAAAALLEECKQRPTIVFASSVSHAERLAEILNRYRPDCARVVTGETNKEVRRGLFGSFGKDYQYLCNYGVATEGVDLPAAHAVAILRPTKSRLLYTQMAGRGTRPEVGLEGGDSRERRERILASRKPNCLLLDFVGIAGKHSLIGPLDLLGGKILDDRTKRKAEKILEDGLVSLTEAKAQAIKWSEEEDRKREERAAKKRLEEEAKRARIRADATYAIESIDPSRLVSEHSQEDMEANPSGPTPEQVSQAQKYGIVLPVGCTRKKANGLLWYERQRRKWGKGTHKQVQLLTKHWNKTFPDRLLSNGEILRFSLQQATKHCQEVFDKWNANKRR